MKNVLIIHTDQQRGDSLGCTGNRYAVTPNIDALAADGGCINTRHISANPVCMPSRASLFSGLLAPGHGVYGNGVPLLRSEYVPDARQRDVQVNSVPTMPDAFAAAGYRTAAIGKLHLTPTRSDASLGYPESVDGWAQGRYDDWNGPYYGFQTVDFTLGHGEGVMFSGGHYAQWLEREHPDVLEDVRNTLDGPVPEQGDLYPSKIPEKLHNTHWIGTRTVDRIREAHEADEPFFVFAGFPDPHHPFTPPQSLWDAFITHDCMEPDDRDLSNETVEKVWPYTRKMTDAMNHFIDRQVGRMVAALKELGLYDETIIVYTSDHGDFQGDHGKLYKTTTTFRSLVHVPLIIRAPGVDLPALSERATSNCDIMPTLCSMCDVPLPGSVDGIDFSSTLSKAGGEAYVSSGNGTENLHHSLVSDRYRVTWYPNRDEVECFDHQEDIGETTNIADDEPELVADALAKISEKITRSYRPRRDHVAPW